MDKVDVQKVKVNGVDLAYAEEGKGETVVLVHGSSGDWRTWDGLRPDRCRLYCTGRCGGVAPAPSFDLIQMGYA